MRKSLRRSVIFCWLLFCAASCAPCFADGGPMLPRVTIFNGSSNVVSLEYDDQGGDIFLMSLPSGVTTYSEWMENIQLHWLSHGHDTVTPVISTTTVNSTPGVPLDMTHPVTVVLANPTVSGGSPLVLVCPQIPDVSTVWFLSGLEYGLPLSLLFLTVHFIKRGLKPHIPD